MSTSLDDLSQAALRYMTDKAPYEGDLGIYHFYTLRYHALFESIRYDVRRVLEIGVQQGASLKMWRDYFPHAEIHGLDSDDCRPQLTGEPRITVHVGDATCPAMLTEMAALGPWDIVLDDGSHNLADMRDTCLALYPHTSSVYVIEDVHVPWFGAELRGALLSLAGEPEVLVSRTTPERVAYIFDKRSGRV